MTIALRDARSGRGADACPTDRADEPAGRSPSSARRRSSTNGRVSSFVAEFIGESNVIEGRVAEGPSFVLGGRRALPDAHAIGSSGRLPADDRAPGEVLTGRPAADTPGALPGVVSGLVYVGDFTRYLVDVEGGVRLIVKVQNRRTTATRAHGGRAGGAAP